MAMSRAASRSKRHPSDWMTAEHSRLVAPSWLLSALFHGLILALVLIISQSKGCQPGFPGEGGESFRSVGVYLTEGETDDEPPPTETPSTMPSEAPSAEFADSPLLDGPPVEFSAPSPSSQPVLGLGPPPSLSTSGGPQKTLATEALTGPPPSTGNALGGATSLFGITAAGRRFVYVFDRSGSMSNYGAIRVAKAELMSSLERLDATQEFQVIFYNTIPMMLEPPNRRTDMFRGNDTQRLDVNRKVSPIEPDGSTKHMPALMMALELNPDVIFFLTDADEPVLNADELATIKRRNNGGTRIHCIEFGQGPSLQSARFTKNFLQKLAEQNDGQYQYRDVTEFR